MPAKSGAHSMGKNGRLSVHDGTPNQRAAMDSLYLDYPAEKELQDIQRPVQVPTSDPDVPSAASRAQFVPGEGSYAPYVIFVGEAPGRQENEAQRPFIGSSGHTLDRALVKYGIPRSKCWITNAVKFWPRTEDGRTRAPDEFEIEASLPYLRRELDILTRRGRFITTRREGYREASPILVPLGRSALTALTGDDYKNEPMAEMSGRSIYRTLPDHPHHAVVNGVIWNIMPCYHPSALRSVPVRQLWDATMNMIAHQISARKEVGFYRHYDKKD